MKYNEDVYFFGSIFMIVLFLYIIVGCGPSKVTMYDDSKIQQRLSDLESRMNTLDDTLNDNTTRVTFLEQSRLDLMAAIDSLNTLILSLQDDQISDATTISGLQTNVNSLNMQLADTVVELDELQGQYETILVQLATLQGYTNIVSIKNPCGNQGSHDEVFLRLSDGKYLASFSDNINGYNTRFSVLTNGNYMTTDGTHCYFSVDSDGTRLYNEHN